MRKSLLSLISLLLLLIFAVESGWSSDESYVAQPGDSLWQIARKLNLDYQRLCSLNPQYLEDHLRVGDRVRLPTGNSGNRAAGHPPSVAAVGNTRQTRFPTVGDTQITLPGQLEENFGEGENLYQAGRWFHSQTDLYARAITAGQVTHLENLRGYGWTIFVQSGEYEIAYSSYDCAPIVRVGQSINSGAPVFSRKNGAGVTSVYVHVFKSETFIDPMAFPRSQSNSPPQ